MPDPRYSAADATATSWAEARLRLAAAELYWLTSIRPDGRPHVTPLIAVWVDGALHLCTGPHEQKARNRAVEGEAHRVTNDVGLARIAGAYQAKYGSSWHFTVGDGHLRGAGGPAIAYRIVPVTAYGFGKTVPSQTRWIFS